MHRSRRPAMARSVEWAVLIAFVCLADFQVRSISRSSAARFASASACFLASAVAVAGGSNGRVMRRTGSEFFVSVSEQLQLPFLLLLLAGQLGASSLLGFQASKFRALLNRQWGPGVL